MGTSEPTPDTTLLPLLTRALGGGDQSPAGGAEAPGRGVEATDERILDAALDLVGAYGARRTSIDDIAARAGVARATVFRRFRNKQGVLDALCARELQRFLTSVRATIAAAPDPAASVVESFVAVVRYAAAHPLLERIARVEPQVLIETLRTGDPSPLDLGRTFVAGRLRAGQARGRIPKRDADELADVLVRLALSYILIPGGRVDLGDERAVRAFARSAIAPIVTNRR
jgi:AcrR family transcriptional regulator